MVVTEAATTTAVWFSDASILRLKNLHPTRGRSSSAEIVLREFRSRSRRLSAGIRTPQGLQQFEPAQRNRLPAAEKKRLIRVVGCLVITRSANVKTQRKVCRRRRTLREADNVD